MPLDKGAKRKLALDHWLNNAPRRRRSFQRNASAPDRLALRTVNPALHLAALARLGPAQLLEPIAMANSIYLATALPTVNGPERSVSRESVAAAKRKATAQASMTRCWRHGERGGMDATDIDTLIEHVRYGRMTPDAAEAEAVRLGHGNLSGEPPDDTFDP